MEQPEKNMAPRKEAFIRQLRSAGLDPLEAMTLMVTSVCNLSCHHCLLNCGTSESTHQVPCPDLLRLIDQFLQLGGSRIILAGGEFFSHPAWQEILRFCVGDKRISAVCIQTNATLIKNAHIEALQGMNRENLTLQVSLDGAHARTHDIVRGAGSHARAMAGLRALVEAGMGPRVHVAFTEMVHNFNELPQLLQDMDNMGIGRLTSSTLVKGGRAAFSTCIGPPTPAQYVKLIELYLTDDNFRKRYDQKARIAAIEWFKNRSANAASHCGCLKNLFIDASGRLYPCTMLLMEEYAMPGIHTTPLDRVILGALAKWREIPLLSKNRPLTLISCSGCKHKSHCGSGCMGRAALDCGELMAPEDRCALRQAVYNLDEKPGKAQPLSTGEETASAVPI